MKSRLFFFFFLLPFLLITAIFFLLFFYNRSLVKTGTYALVHEQITATASILKTGIARELAGGASAETALERHDNEDNIYFMALLDEHRNVIAWRSKFEGYLPFSWKNAGPETTWVIHSPAGEIFNLLTAFSPQGTGIRHLYLGYSLTSLATMMARTESHLWIFLVILVMAGAVVARGAFLMQVRFLAKEKEAENALAEQQRMREISAFTSGVAHETKNPLNSLSLLFNLLQKKASPELQEHILLGKKEVSRIVEVIDRFSDAMKPLAVRPKRVFLREIIGSVLDSMDKEKPGSPARIHTGVSTDIPLTADARLLSLIISNLVKNALEASPVSTVRISAEKTRKTAILFIEDDGPGMPDELRRKIFEPFISGKSGGMGVGLYLVKRAVEAHGGKIEVRSSRKNGTLFIVHIPGG